MLKRSSGLDNDIQNCSILHKKKTSEYIYSVL